MSSKIKGPKKKRKQKTPEEKLYDKHDKILKEHDQLIENVKIVEDKYEYLLKKILINTQKLWLPNKENKKKDKFYNNKGIEYTSHSWFNITEYNAPLIYKEYDAKIEVPIITELIKCEKIKMYPTDLQKVLLLNWMNAYVKMYNATIKLFKKNRFNKEKLTLNWKTIRTKYMKDIKKDILEASNIQIKVDENDNKKNPKYHKATVNTHILDFAVQDACAKYKSCLTNLRNGNIKHFRLRYLKQSKDTLVMKIEKNFISANKNTFCSTIFKDSFKLQDDFQLKNINCDFIIHYNRRTDEFQLLNPIKINQVKEHSIKESAGVDPGIRTFLTVFSNGKCIKIGSNLIPIVLKYLKKLDKVNSMECKKKPRIKDKLRKKYYKKINNFIDDLHWKSINYLTANFGSVLIGNMSTKSIISNESKNQLDDNIKRVAQHMSLHKFRMRLAYKCQQKSIGYSDVDEAFTTMACTRCGYKNDVGKKKKIHCSFCKLKIDRDFAGGRNILLRGTERL